MGKIILGMTVSLDGFINDQHGDLSLLYHDLGALRESELLQETIESTGAVMMGRRTYDMAQGNFTGYEFQVPLFILTHEAPPQAAKGANDRLTFTYVDGPVEDVITQAQAAAGDKDIVVIGGADLAQQLLCAGLVDELHVDVMPVLLGEGCRLFEHLGSEPRPLERAMVAALPADRTHLRYEIVKQS